jgi:hypothetical protein
MRGVKPRPPPGGWTADRPEPISYKRRLLGHVPAAARYLQPLPEDCPARPARRKKRKKR